MPKFGTSSPKASRSRLHGLASTAAAALLLGAMAPALARPPFGDFPERGRRQVEESHREEIRRSVGRPDDYRPDTYRERRRMSDEERQSLRQAVRDAYGDPRNRRRD